MGIAVARSVLDSNTANDFTANDLLLVFSVFNSIDFLHIWAVKNLPLPKGRGVGEEGREGGEGGSIMKGTDPSGDDDNVEAIVGEKLFTHIFSHTANSG